MALEQPRDNICAATLLGMNPIGIGIYTAHQAKVHREGFESEPLTGRSQAEAGAAARREGR